MKKWVVVIPSIRRINLKYIKYIPEDIEIYVVDDSDGNITPNRKNMKVFYYKDQKELMKENYDLIPHKTAACRNFAFYYIFKETDYQYILSLDDDCMVPSDYLYSYERVLGKTLTLPTVVGTKWLNTISLMNINETIYARGYPYYERGQTSFIIKQSKGRVVCNMGLWEVNLDIDGFDRFVLDKYSKVYENIKLAYPYYRVGTTLEPVKFPFSAMNFGFIREILPIMSQVPMNIPITDDYKIWRFDDIWAGYIAQNLIHLKGDAITVGKPIVKHIKHGDIRKEIYGEHYGHLISPYFYLLIDDALKNIEKDEYSIMYNSLLFHSLRSLEKLGKKNKIPDLYYKFLKSLLTKMYHWSELFIK